tara:strand:+ start:1526 stop:1735 length:210 start_codon:yes stop_codon:yes gene_type:complete
MSEETEIVDNEIGHNVELVREEFADDLSFNALLTQLNVPDPSRVERLKLTFCGFSDITYSAGHPVPNLR